MVTTLRAELKAEVPVSPPDVLVPVPRAGKAASSLEGWVASSVYR